MKMCLTEVMEAAAKCNMAVLVKHNMEDGFKSGIQVPESIEIAKEIEKFGVHGIVLSSGFVSRAPMAVMRGRSLQRLWVTIWAGTSGYRRLWFHSLASG